MTGAPILAPDAKRMEERRTGSWSGGEIPAWDLDSPPRLHETDLADPESFHRRLVDWIMNQK